MAECIDNYLEAAQACEWCATENTRIGDEDMARGIELCRAVADDSILHAHMLAQDSDYSSDLGGPARNSVRHALRSANSTTIARPPSRPRSVPTHAGI